MVAAKRFCEVLMGLCVLWTISALLVLFIKCDPSITSAGGATCEGEYARWTAISTADLLIEAVSLGLVCVLVNHIQLKRSHKIAVTISFVPRVALVIPAALHAASIKNTASAEDVAFAHVDQAVWLQTMLAWSLLTCSIPSFKAALRPFERGGATYSTSTDRRAYDEAAGNLFVGPTVKTIATKGGRTSQRAQTRATIHSSLRSKQEDHGDRIQVDVDITVLHESGN
ncbi:hypothetical protein BDZ85DRAFT_260565 [Elsinoe ampelina]|uniref:Rhodopsin domain-containing protein n=1 Tax=Elsinoe ampelina TaxID=302913 RepID=A0A6A6GET6_9PEZI|nr:hypothetical protein BDZ85DRAFT_260565 [Elsinoe ampelina]